MNKYIIAVVLAVSGAPVAFAADALPLPEEDAPLPAERPDWVLQVTPSLWAAGLDGDISPFRRGPTIGIEKSFSDVMDALNVGGFVNIWGRYDRFVLSGDVMYVDTTDSHESGKLPAFEIPGLGVVQGLNIDAEVDTTEFTATLMGGYRVIDTPQFTLDALGGGRFWQISNDVKITGSVPNLGSRSVSHDENFSWVDPLVGMRAFLSVTDRLSVQAQGDIGGFGVGSDFTWSAMATINYVLTNRLSASAGYKILDVDYDHDGHVFDTQLQGPVAGMTLRF